MNVVASESDCEFRFDYSKVYWNSRLGTEHARLIDKFQEGEAVCDVMAGVGPFAIPAGKKKCFVWANDLNPDSCVSLEDAITRNKVSRFVRGFNGDGRDFIKKATQRLLSSTVQVTVQPRVRRHGSDPSSTPPSQDPPQVYTQPRTFQHYVMNLPATAIEFLDAFISVYVGCEDLFWPHTNTKLPMIHVYCFEERAWDREFSDDYIEEKLSICQRISERIGFEVRPTTAELEIWDVRLVSPKKRMFCVSFRLPPEVAFRHT